MTNNLQDKTHPVAIQFKDKSNKELLEICAIHAEEFQQLKQERDEALAWALDSVVAFSQSVYETGQLGFGDSNWLCAFASEYELEMDKDKAKDVLAKRDLEIREDEVYVIANLIKTNLYFDKDTHDLLVERAEKLKQKSEGEL